METLFLGIKGHVVCLDKYTGQEQWRTKLKSDWGKPTMLVYSERLFAYLAGTLYCLNAESGEILWKNPLKGLGSGSCMISVKGRSSAEPEDQSQSMASEMIDAVVDLSS